VQRGERCLFSSPGARVGKTMDGFSLGRVQQHREKKSLLRELSSTRLSGTFSGEISGDKIRLRHGCHAGLFAALCTLLGPLLSHTHIHTISIYLSRRVRDSFSTRVSAVQITLLREQDLQPLSPIMATFFS